MEAFTPDEVAAALSALPSWRADGDRAIARDLAFGDFAGAMAFMTAVALRAERADHHPEWSNVYDKVSIRLTTHVAGGVTQRDVALAHEIDDLAESFGRPSVAGGT